jgi:hypothetical protein
MWRFFYRMPLRNCAGQVEKTGAVFMTAPVYMARKTKSVAFSPRLKSVYGIANGGSIKGSRPEWMLTKVVRPGVISTVK